MNFADFVTAAEKGAATIYHDVVATGVAITHWESNPAIAPLVQIGIAGANAMLARAGFDPRVIEADIHAALKGLAALDPTVVSGTGLLHSLAIVAGAVYPPALPAVAALEAMATVAQAVGHPAT